MNISSIYKQIALTLIRHALTLLAASLVSHAVISQEQATMWIPEVAGGVLFLLISVGSALWVKVKQRVAFLAALDLPSASTTKDVKELVAGLTPTEKWNVATGDRTLYAVTDGAVDKR